MGLGTAPEELTELGFTIFGFVSKPVEEVYEAVRPGAALRVLHDDDVRV